jgi:phage recombination protein Bet
MSNIVLSNAAKLATGLGISGDPQELVATLKATAFKGPATDSQLAALLFVASQYGLNPWVKELYAFPDRQNGIVPVVGVDGWSRIINNHPQFDGMDFEQDEESCTCIVYRKDRGHPIRVTEWMAECRRDGVGPWKSHPRRMLRHKAMIQCARLAFGYTGIFDQDEAERIQESTAPAAAHPAAPEPSAELLEAAQDAASQGVEAYKAFWQQAAPDDRRALARNHAAFKGVAESADASRTVTDVEAREVANADS